MGRIVQFDENRGYGFIAPDGGGEDVFVHVNMLGSDRWSLAPGVPVEFQAVDSERGPKALTVRVLESEAATRVPAQNPSAAGAVTEGGNRADPSHTQWGVPTTGGPTPSASEPGTDDDFCDVVSERAFHTEITESLLSSVPSLTGAQIVAVRQVMIGLARRHGWVEKEA